ncbi:hypothetical protein H0W80_03945 [Candidatus Saccharibacteria bacterium]|nr:hypothetical protein [Candidatus Saccharibacteria bacterium]
MRTILEAIEYTMQQLEVAHLDYSVDFAQVAQSKLEERTYNFGYPVTRLISSDPHQYMFQISNLIVEVEETSMAYMASLGETIHRRIIGVSMYGIDQDGGCEPYELGDITEFGVERIALVMKDLAGVEFCAERVRPWMQQADVLAA